MMFSFLICPPTHFICAIVNTLFTCLFSINDNGIFKVYTVLYVVNEDLFCTGVTTLLRDPWGGLSLVPLITSLLLLILRG